MHASVGSMLLIPTRSELTLHPSNQGQLYQPLHCPLMKGTGRHYVSCTEDMVKSLVVIQLNN